MGKPLHNLGKKLRQLRLFHNLTQNKWALLSGKKSKGEISAMECGADLNVSTLLHRIECIGYTLAFIPIVIENKKVHKELQYMLRFYTDYQILLVLECRRAKRRKKK